MNIFDNYAARYERTREEEYSMQEYLELCKKDKLAYASASERLLAAIGEPEFVDTRHDPRLSRIFPIKSSKSILRSVSFTAWKKSSSRWCRIFAMLRRAWRSASKLFIFSDLLAVVNRRLPKSLKC